MDVNRLKIMERFWAGMLVFLMCVGMGFAWMQEPIPNTEIQFAFPSKNARSQLSERSVGLRKEIPFPFYFEDAVERHSARLARNNILESIKLHVCLEAFAS